MIFDILKHLVYLGLSFLVSHTDISFLLKSHLLHPVHYNQIFFSASLLLMLSNQIFPLFLPSDFSLLLIFLLYFEEHAISIYSNLDSITPIFITSKKEKKRKKKKPVVSARKVLVCDRTREGING